MYLNNSDPTPLLWKGLGCCPGWDVKGLSHLSQLQRLPDHSELEYLVGTVSLSFSVKRRAMLVCNYTAFSLSRHRGFSSLFSHTREGQGCLGISAQVSKISPVLPSPFPNVQLLSVCRRMGCPAVILCSGFLQKLESGSSCLFFSS